ncbi:hypothetical protein, partial [Pseudomonas brassicacearum]|uniref:hypothetical protein n=1 Tax=Pseudomonas brassicacearum TaxID=930166 RepID=UPI0034672315
MNAVLTDGVGEVQALVRQAFGVGVYIRWCGNGCLWFRPDGGSLSKSAKVTKALLPHPAFFKVVVASTVLLCRFFLGLLFPIRVQQHRSYRLPVAC